MCLQYVAVLIGVTPMVLVVGWCTFELCDDSSIAPSQWAPWAPNLVGFEVVTAQMEVVPELLT